MARWRLTEPHYLNVPGTEYEHTEIDQQTQKPARKRWPVPAYLEVDTIVCHGKPERGDVVFVGPPTPSMEPLDEEAEALSNQWKETWIAPMGEAAFPSNSPSASMLPAGARR